MNILPYVAKRAFPDEVMLRILGWVGYPGTSGKSDVIIRVSVRRRQEGWSQEEGPVMTEVEIGVMYFRVEEGPTPQNTGGH